MKQTVTYRFRIEKSQLTRSLRKHCVHSTIWVSIKVENVSHIPARGDAVGGEGGIHYSLRVFDRHTYVSNDWHTTLIECVTVKRVDYDERLQGADPMVPIKPTFTKDDLRKCVVFGWTVEQLDNSLFLKA